MPQNGHQPSTLYLKAIRLQNMRGFQEVDVSFLSGQSAPRMMTLLLGDNGSGKSTLLRALAIGLCQQKEASSLIGGLAGDFIRVNKQGRSLSNATIELDLVDRERPEKLYRTRTRVERDASGQEILTKETEPAEDFPWPAIFACGYGVNRGTGQRAEQPPATYSRRDALATLFDDNAALLDPEDTLRAIKLAVEEDGDGADRFHNLQLNLRRLLQLIRYQIQVSSKEVRIHGPWGALPFHALGDGYRGTAGWFLDLCRRAHIAGRLPASGTPAGIVLIDEIDEHLHPSWQKRLIPLLRQRFPLLQFVGTTHSAMSIVNCAPDELLAAGLKNTIAALHPLSGPEGRTADTILRGEWFGLTSTLDDGSEKLLEKYQQAIAAQRPELELEPLRTALRQRLGRLIESPLDELALEIAAQVRAQARQATTPEQKAAVLAAAAESLREKIRLRSAHRQDLAAREGAAPQ